MGKGGFNVKLLKLHGSLNWLQCPRCNRLFVDFDNKIAVGQYITKKHAGIVMLILEFTTHIYLFPIL